MSVPTVILDLKVEDQQQRVGEMPPVRSVNFELSKESLGTLLDGMSKIRTAGCVVKQGLGTHQARALCNPSFYPGWEGGGGDSGGTNANSFVTHAIRTYPCGIGTSSFPSSVRSCSACISHRETLHIYFFNKYASFNNSPNNDDLIYKNTLK